MIEYHNNFEQGSMEWLEARCGLLTASEMDRVLTPTLKIAANAASKTHLYDLMAQRITGYLEPAYQSDAMLRGKLEEKVARDAYSEKYAPVIECGFVTNDSLRFTLGYSPDGLVRDDGLIEVKSRAQKHQMQTIIAYGAQNPPVVPPEYMLQIQTGLFVTGRKWCDFISICSGLNMLKIRVAPDEKYFEAIKEAATAFEDKMAKSMETYREMIADESMITPIKERVETEIY